MEIAEAARNLALACDHFHTLHYHPPKWSADEIQQRRNEIVADIQECIEELRTAEQATSKEE